MLVGTDYFTKWVKAEPLLNIRDVDANKFVWKNIVTRFGVPRTLISNNGLLTYGAKAVIPLETGFPTLRMSSFDSSNNDKLLGKSLDFIDERRENAMVQLAYYQHKFK